MTYLTGDHSEVLMSSQLNYLVMQQKLADFAREAEGRRLLRDAGDARPRRSRSRFVRGVRTRGSSAETPVWDARIEPVAARAQGPSPGCIEN